MNRRRPGQPWRYARLAPLLLVLLIGSLPLALLHAAPSLSVKPSSGVAGSDAFLSGSGWSFGSAPYEIFWDAAGGTSLGTFVPSPNTSAWEEQVIIPKSEPGKHIIIACEAYGIKGKEACAGTSFEVLQPPTPAPTDVPTSTSTNSPTNTPTVRPTETPVPSGTPVPPSPSPTRTRTPTATATRTAAPGVPTPTATRFNPNQPPAPTDTVSGGPTKAVPPTATPTATPPPIAVGVGGACTEVPAGALVVGFDEPGAEYLPDLYAGAPAVPGREVSWPRAARFPPFELPARSAPNAADTVNEAAPRTGTWSTAGTFMQVWLADGDVNVVMRAYDQFGREVASASDIARVSDPPFSRCLSVSAPGIAAVSIEASTYRPERFYIDDFFFVPDSTAELECTDRIFFTSPGPRTTVEGPAAVRLEGEFRLRGAGLGPPTLAYRGVEYQLADGFYEINNGRCSSFGSSPDCRFYGRVTTTRDPADRFRRTFRFELSGERLGDPDYARGFWELDFHAELPVGSCTAGTPRGQANLTILGIPPGATPVPTVPYNLSVHGMEVTQGVRGQIAVRLPDGDTVLEPDSWTHVADRKTVVRVYPWLEFSDRTSRGTTARLYGSRGGTPLPGSPISPVASLGTFERSWFLGDLRGNIARSWNFVLPGSWTGDGTIQLRVEINPPGPGHVDECGAGVRVPAGARCFGAEDNTADLAGVRFQSVEGLTIHPFLVRYTDAAGAVTQPTFDQFVTQLDWVWRTWPISDTGWSISWPRVIDYSGALDNFAAGTFPFSDWSQRNYMPCVGGDCRYPVGTMYAFFLPNAVAGCGGMAWYGWPWSESGAGCGPTTAQEFAHTFAYLHAGNSHGEGAGGGFDSAYPDFHGALESVTYGFDLEAMQPVSPNPGAGHTHDFLSYGGGTQWVSAYTWSNLLRALRLGPRSAVPVSSDERFVLAGPPAAAARRSEGRALRIGGRLADGKVTFSPAFEVVSAGALESGGGSGDYRLELRDAGGNVLVARNFDPLRAMHGAGDAGIFALDLPLVSGVRELRVLRGATLLATQAVPAQPPSVTLISPRSGEQWGASGSVDVRWEATVPDGDALVFRLEASHDGGKTWEALVPETPQTGATLDLSLLPVAGDGWQVRIQASDGFNVATAVADSVSAAPKAPLALILQPANGSQLASGQDLRLAGQAVDLEDGTVRDGGLSWLVDGAVAGVGRSAGVAGLSNGQHRLNLRATNQRGLTGEMSVDVTVVADSDGDGLADEWEAQYGLDPANPQDAALDDDSDNLSNWQELAYGTRPDRRDTDGDRYTDDVEIAGGGDPNDANSVPSAIHGREGLPVPHLSSGSRPLDLWWLYVLGGLTVAGAVGAWRWRSRRTREPTAPSDPSGNTDDQGQ